MVRSLAAAGRCFIVNHFVLRAVVSEGWGHVRSGLSDTVMTSLPVDYTNKEGVSFFFFMFYDLLSLCLIQIKTLLGQIFVAKLISDSVKDRSRTEGLCGWYVSPVEATPPTALVVLSYIYFSPSICFSSTTFRTVSCINIILYVCGCSLLLQAILNEPSEQSEIQREAQ